MQAIRRRLATTAVAALLALFCGCPPATATEQTPGEPMLMGAEDTGVPGLEEGGVPESTGYISQDPTPYAAQEAQVTEPAYAQTQTPEADVRLTDADDIVSYSVTCEYAINKHGNLIMDHSFDKLLEQGFEEGDVLTVTINGILTCPRSLRELAMLTEIIMGRPAKNMMRMYFTASSRISSA